MNCTLRDPKGNMLISIEADIPIAKNNKNISNERISSIFRDAVEELVSDNPDQKHIDRFLKIVRQYRTELSDTVILSDKDDVMNERYIDVGKRAADWYREASLLDGSNHPKHCYLTKVPEVKRYLFLYCKKVNVDILR